jgi:hypothetical protein
MLRVLLVASVAMLATSAAAGEGAPFRAGVQPDGKKSAAPLDRKQLVEKIHRDLTRASDKLGEKDAGAATALQKQILANIKKLLENDDPPPPSSDNPPPNGSPPSGSPPSDSPKPKSKLNDPSTPELKPQPTERPQPRPEENVAQRPKETPGNAVPQNLPDPREQMKLGGSWPTMRSQQRAEIDAYGSSRFVRGYEELLREYYRSIAESSRRND